MCRGPKCIMIFDSDVNIAKNIQHERGTTELFRRNNIRLMSICPFLQLSKYNKFMYRITMVTKGGVYLHVKLLSFPFSKVDLAVIIAKIKTYRNRNQC